MEPIRSEKSGSSFKYRMYNIPIHHTYSTCTSQTPCHLSPEYQRNVDLNYTSMRFLDNIEMLIFTSVNSGIKLPTRKLEYTKVISGSHYIVERN